MNKAFEEKLKELKITPKTINHSYEYLYKCYMEIWNLAIEEAAKIVKNELYIKGTYKGAKWHKLKIGDSYNPLENDVCAKINKNELRKLKV